jgi:hypothetical protein
MDCGLASRPPPSLAVTLVLHETFEKSDVTGFPIGQVGFFDHDRCANTPGESRLVNELNVDEEDALLEFVFHPIHDSAVSTGILFAARERFGFLRSSFLNSTLVHSLVLNFRRYVIMSCASASG